MFVLPSNLRQTEPYVNQPTLYQTPFASPQLELFELDDEQWLKVGQRTYIRRQKRVTQLARQPQLTNSDQVA